MSTDVRKAERIVGVDWYSTLYKVAGSFSHSDVMQAIEAAQAINNKEKYHIPFGPQLNEMHFQWAANVSIFWLRALILATPRVFHRQVKQAWIDEQAYFAGFTLEFLRNLPHPSLHDQAVQLDHQLEKIGPLEPLIDQV